MSESNFGIMIDHETLGVDPESVVLQVAMVAFDLTDGSTTIDGFDFDFKQNVEVDAQQKLGRTVDMKTIAWWLAQDDDARKRVNTFEYGTIEQLRQRMNGINAFINFRRQYAVDSGGKFQLWSRGSMDVNQMESLFRTLGIKPAWKYNEVMDLRTAMNLMQIADVQPQKGHVPHDCLSDCHYQIKCYREILRQQGEIE